MAIISRLWLFAAMMLVTVLTIIAVAWLFAVILVAQDDEPGRPYHPVAIRAMAATKWTHVAVTGTVTRVVREADGDYHVWLSDGADLCPPRRGASPEAWSHCLTVEIIPAIPLRVPKKGERVTIKGISRYDGAHRWAELHPAESIEVLR